MNQYELDQALRHERDAELLRQLMPHGYYLHVRRMARWERFRSWLKSFTFQT